MDRSTEITIRSAIIIACMILVPLWAVMGTSWTVVLNAESTADTPAHPPTRGKSSGDTHREPSKSAEFPSMASVAPQTSTAVPNVPPVTVTAPLVPPVENTHPVASPTPTVPVTPIPSPPPAPAIAAAPPVTPPSPASPPVIEIRSSAPPVANRIGIDNAPAVPQVAIRAMNVGEPGTTQVIPVSTTQVSPANDQSALQPATPGDWFQWTESRLKNLGATQFILESAGEMGGYRFRCKAALPNDPGFSRHFEATGPTALDAMQEALRQIDAWRIHVR